MHNQTIVYYNENAAEFCRDTKNVDMSFCRDKFINLLKTGAKILDVGCGSGRDAKAFLDMGYQVTAIDASEQICREAEQLLGQTVVCMDFQSIDFRQKFDGIWACASLLHVPKQEMNEVLQKLRIALKEEGVLYASFKYGNGERISRGRFFNDYNEDLLKELIEHCHFKIIEIFITQDVREGRNAERWVNVLARKEGRKE